MKPPYNPEYMPVPGLVQVSKRSRNITLALGDDFCLKTSILHLNLMGAQRADPSFENTSHIPLFSLCPSLYPRNFYNSKYLSGGVVIDVTIDDGGLEFDSQDGQIRHRVANGSTPLRCFFGAV